MTNDLQVFDNPDFGAVRMIKLEGEPWFVANDVCVCLGYTNPKNGYKLCKHLKTLNVSEMETLGVSTVSPRGLGFIPESDIYRLVMRSSLPNAEKFQDWVMEEVLPSIRKTGVYGTTARVDWEGARTILSTLYSGNQLTLALDNVYRNACGGKSLLGMAESPKLLTQNKQQLLTVTDVGAMHNPPLSAKKMNKLLVAAGMQNNINGKWVATEKGEKYSEYLDTGKQYCAGKPIRCLNWYPSVLNAIETE